MLSSQMFQVKHWQIHFLSKPWAESLSSRIRCNSLTQSCELCQTENYMEDMEAAED